MFRVLESHRVQFTIHDTDRGRFRRELLAVPLPDHDGELALVRVRSLEEGPTRGAVLLVHGFGMNRHTWHLNGRSLVGHLAASGFDIFVAELRGVGRSRELHSNVAHHVDEYIRYDLPALVSASRARSGHERIFIVGHSMGGLVTYCGMSDLEPYLAGVVTLSAVFSFAGESRILNLLSGLGRRLPVPRKTHNTPFAVKAIGRTLRSWIQVADSRAVLLLLPFQAWYPRGIERRLLTEQIRIGWDVSSIGVLLNLLRIGRDGELVSREGRRYLDEMREVDLPLLVLAAEHDTLLPPSDARRAYDQSASTDKEFVAFGPARGDERFGHIDMILGQHAPRQIWPHLTRWLEQRSQTP